MNKISNKTELAVIFKKDYQGLDQPTLFYPVEVIIGTFHPENMTFTDQQGRIFFHIFGNAETYGFALRKTVGRLNYFYKKRHLNSLLKSYLKDLKLSFYYYASEQQTNLSNLMFISEDTENHTTYALKDKDLSRAVHLKEQEAKMILEKLPKPQVNAKTLIEKINQKVIGQEEAIENIVSIIWQNSKSDKKSNILLAGPTGVGKTEIIRIIAKELQIPMVIINAASLTQTGYVGDSVDDILVRLLAASNFETEKAEQGIIVLDELDKLAGNSNSNNSISSTGVQDELLKLLEDGTYYIKVDSPSETTTYTINTSKITVIGIGAFTSMVKKEPIGYRNKMTNSTTIAPSKITPEDLFQYGLTKELVGRLPNIFELAPLTKETLIQIMKNPNRDILSTKLKILNQEKIQVIIKENVYDLIADIALEKQIGARGLISAIDALFMKAMIEISKNEGIYETLILDENTVRDAQKYTLIKKR